MSSARHAPRRRGRAEGGGPRVCLERRGRACAARRHSMFTGLTVGKVNRSCAGTLLECCRRHLYASARPGDAAAAAAAAAAAVGPLKVRLSSSHHSMRNLKRQSAPLSPPHETACSNTNENDRKHGADRQCKRPGVDDCSSAGGFRCLIWEPRGPRGRSWRK